MPRGIGPRQPRSTKRGYNFARPPAPTKKPAKRTATRSTAAPKTAAATAKPGLPPKGYDPVTPARARDILARLDATYPQATCALTHGSAWELLVATILSAQCTDERVNKVTPLLFPKYPTVQHFAALQPAELEPDIRSTGFFRNKSKSVVGAAKKVVGEFGGQVPDTMEQLLTLPGVARKTANVLLGTWFQRNDGVVVDTHVTRIARRLELTRNDDPVKIEQDLMRVVPRPRWTDFSHQVIGHGRKVCSARQPQCAACPLERLCHAADKTWSTVAMHRGAR